MRIPIWPGIRLSVWERQNPEAVTVALARGAARQPVRRVLSVRGWMLLSVRYDWKDNEHYPVENPSMARLVGELTKELHRRSTHLDVYGTEAADVPDGVVMSVRGEVLGLQAALGIALGGTVKGGNADELALEHYKAWMLEGASEGSRCQCAVCVRVLAGEGPW